MRVKCKTGNRKKEQTGSLEFAGLESGIIERRPENVFFRSLLLWKDGLWV